MPSNIFALDEILKLAIEIENNGREFYINMSERVSEDELKRILNFLASEEEKHKKVFEDILKNLDTSNIVESYSGEYQAYLRALADECVFTNDLVKQKASEGFSSSLELLIFALRIEKDSIILYTEMKDKVLKKEEELNRVIEEERKHFVMISELRNKYKEER